MLALTPIDIMPVRQVHQANEFVDAARDVHLA
jgi:hypothetical protein